MRPGLNEFKELKALSSSVPHVKNFYHTCGRFYLGKTIKLQIKTQYLEIHKRLPVSSVHVQL